MRTLGLHSFCGINISFHCSYLDIKWGMQTVAFSVIVVLLMEDTPDYGIMEMLHQYYPERRDEIVEILGIDLNWIVHQLSDNHRRPVKIHILLLY